jgi:hypothetical protein
MRKKIIIAAAIILLLLLSFFGWLQYRQYRSWKIPVHKDIMTVARINTDDLIRDFIKEYGIGFSKKIKKNDGRSSDSTKNTGIYFPGNIFIYNISSRLPTTLFCSLPVFDLDDFRAYIKNRMGIFLTDSAGLFKGISADGKVTIVCNKDYISIAYSKEKEEVITVLTEILRGTNTLSQHDMLAEKLKKEGSLFTATNGLYSFNIDIDGKKLILHSSFNNFRRIQIPGSLQYRAAEKYSTAFFFANFYPAASLFKPHYNIKQYSIEPDSVLNYFNGYSDIEIGPVTKQTDTLTTYEYDDNFEKVEKQTLTEVKVPSVSLSLLMKPGIVTYLQNQEFITKEMKLNKEIFPLYNVDVSFSGGMLHFRTNDSATDKSAVFSPANAFAEADIDLRKTIASLDIPSLQGYVKNIRSLKVTGKKLNGRIIIDASIDFENAALKDIINILKN